MTFIAPNTVYDKRLSLGGGVLYLSPTVVTDKTSLPTNFRNLGTIDKDNTSEFNFQMEKLQWKSGTPSRTVYEAIINSEITFNTQLSEIDVNTLAIALNSTPTYTLAGGDSTVAASPAPTATVFDVAAATDFAVNDLIEIDLGTGGTADKHYRRIKTLSGTTITIDEALPEAPAESDTVKEVSKTEFMLANTTTPTYYGLKFVKVHPLLNKKLTIVLFKAAMTTQSTLRFQDDAKNVLPVSFSAMSDPNVESGALGVAWMEANA